MERVSDEHLASIIEQLEIGDPLKDMCDVDESLAMLALEKVLTYLTQHKGLTTIFGKSEIGT